MTWTKIWLQLFGTTTFMGLDMGFWITMLLVVLVVILMNIIFWSLKPQNSNHH